MIVCVLYEHIFLQRVREGDASIKSLCSEMETKKSHYERRIGELTGAQNDCHNLIQSSQVCFVRHCLSSVIYLYRESSFILHVDLQVCMWQPQVENEELFQDLCLLDHFFVLHIIVTL